jgi:hypothetical protein
LIYLDSSILHGKFIVVQPVDDLKVDWFSCAFREELCGTDAAHGQSNVMGEKRDAMP